MDNHWILPLAVAALTLVGIFAVWRVRARALRQWLRSLEFYADREIARELRRKARNGKQRFATVLGAPGASAGA
jgi:hypothetical protein